MRLTREMREHIRREVSRHRRELVPYEERPVLQEGDSCALCGSPLVLKTGPPKRYCNTHCRKTAWQRNSDSPGAVAWRQARHRKNRVAVAQINTTELAWAAGFFEGEGTVSSARPRKRIRIRAAITQNGGTEARALLERFVSAVGLGKVNGPYDYAGRYQNTPTKKPRWVVQYQNDAAVQHVMSALDPYLSDESPKRVRYSELLAEAQREQGGEQPS